MSNRNQIADAHPRADSFQYLRGGPVVVFRWRNCKGWPVEYVTSNALQMFGHTADDFLSGTVPYASVICPQDVERVGNEILAAVEGGAEHFEQAYRFLHQDGSVRHLYDYTVVLRNAEGEVTHFEGYVLDDTDRRNAEIALQEEEEDSRRLVEIAEVLAGDLTYAALCQHALDAVRGYVPLSRAALYMQASVGGKMIERLACVNPSPGLSQSRFQDMDENPWSRESFAAKTPMLALNAEKDPRCRGRSFELADVCSVLVIPMKLTSGKSAFISMANPAQEKPVTDSPRLQKFLTRLGVILLTAMDRVTTLMEREAIREQLHHAHRMEAVGLLAGGVAHNFNNTLTVILGYTSMLLHDENLEDSVRAKLRAVFHAGESSAAAVRQLLDFSRKQKTHKPEAIDASQVLDDLDIMLQPLIGEGTRLSITQEDDLGCVLLEPGELEMVLMNLAINAKDAVQGDGSLFLRAGQSEDGFLWIEVEDDGVGMSEDVQRRLFEPFFTTKEGAGTGLGLSAVYGLMQRAGGSIEVHSVLGEGSTFVLKFPSLNTSLPAINDTELGPSPRGRGRVVLLVEDQEPVRRLAHSTLCGGGFQVVMAENGADAIRLIKDGTLQIDLLLSDVIMPEMDGLELCRQFATLRPEVPILLMSGFVDRVFPGGGSGGQGIPFLRKPFTAAQLIVAADAAILQG